MVPRNASLILQFDASHPLQPPQLWCAPTRCPSPHCSRASSAPVSCGCVTVRRVRHDSPKLRYLAFLAVVLVLLVFLAPGPGGVGGGGCAGSCSCSCGSRQNVYTRRSCCGSGSARGCAIAHRSQGGWCDGCRFGRHPSPGWWCA